LRVESDYYVEKKHAVELHNPIKEDQKKSKHIFL
jgi:hypothetical protein